MSDLKEKEILKNLEKINIIDNIDLVNYQLREPISSIFASLPLLSENINNLDVEKANKNLQVLYEKTYQMIKNVENISIAAKIISKKIISADIIDYSSLLQSVFNSAGMVLPNYVVFDTDIEDGAIIKSNKSLLNVAFFNLILNSLDYRKEDDVQIKCSLRVNKKKCVLTYEDNSIGIKPEFLEHIFHPYFTQNPYADGEISTKMGLGLYIAKSAVALANGTILTSSVFGEGVKFVISLPIISSDEKTVLKSKPSDFMINKYSEMFVQLCEYCILPNI